MNQEEKEANENEGGIALINKKALDDEVLLEHADPRSSPSVFDDIYKSIGDNGLYHVLVYLFSQLIEASCAASIIFFIWEVANPGITCNDDPVYLYSNNATKPMLTEREICSAGCSNITYNKEFWSIVGEWNLVCERAYLAKLVGTMFFAGVLIGALLAGQLSDWFGRKRTLMVVWMMLIISQSSLYFIRSFELYICVRTFVGICNGGVVCICPIITLEYFGPTRRTIACYRFGWKIGPLMTVLMAYFLRTWRWLALGVGLFTLPIYPFMLFFMPESARWLIQRNRIDEAYKWLEKMAKLNKKIPPKKELLRKIAQSQQFTTSTTKYSFIDLVRTREMFKRTAVMSYAWFSVSLLWYGILSHIGTMSGDLYLNASIQAIGDTLFRWTSIFIIHWLGRRKSYPLYMGIGGFAMLLILIFDATGYTAAHPTVKSYLALAAFILTGGAWGVVNLYATELFPTLLRNAACGAANFGARIASMLSPQITFLGTIHYAVPFAILGFTSISSLTLNLLFLPETKDKPLPEDLPPEAMTQMRNICTTTPVADVESRLDLENMSVAL